MDWTDEGIVLSARRHGETSVIVSLMTREHGRHAGLVRGGAGTRARGVYQPGNRVAARWRARLAEHLGTYTCELTRADAAALLDDPAALAALASAASLVDSGLAEREPHGTVFEGLSALLEALMRPGWPADYVRWELAFLAELGFGLDLSECAATGANDDLVYVSPKSGRAVSAAAGEAYRSRLFALPSFLIDAGEAAETVSSESVIAGLSITGHFLEARAFAPDERRMPPARTRLVDRLRE